MTNTMLGSITFRALGIHARRNLDFLLYAHASHAGRENGNLAAPYQQLEAWGATAADVRKGFAELIAAGLVDRTVQGLRQAGGGEPSRYALTWLPTRFGSLAQAPPTHRWQAVIEQLGRAGIGGVTQVRRWLREETAGSFGGRKQKQRSTSHLQVVSPITCKEPERTMCGSSPITCKCEPPLK
ncbi:MAG: hypothetical protein ACHP84_04195 [Caulobacterales bacterium]